MANSRIRTDPKELKRVIIDIEGFKTASRSVVSKTVNDLAKRAPAWVAKSVTELYNIKKSEIAPTEMQKSKGAMRKLIGYVKLQGHGEPVASVMLTYRSRLLTPVHFNMTPKTPPRGKSYTLKAEFFKGKKEVISRVKANKEQDFAANLRKQGKHTSAQSPIMLMGTGTKSQDKVPYIPFQRTSTERNDVEVFKTLSLSQMVTNPTVSEAIKKTIETNASARLAHYMKQEIK